MKIRDLVLLAIDPVVAPGIISSDYLGSFHTLRSISKTGRVPGFSIDFFFKKIIVECIASHSRGVHVWLRWCQGQRSEAEGPRDSGDDEVGVLRKIHRGRARRWSIPAVDQGPTWESGQLTQVQSNCDPLGCAAKELGWGEKPEPYEEGGADKRVEELSVRASQEKDEEEEDEKLDLVQMTREMHICLHEESNEIMKWTEANKGNEYNIEKKRY